MNYSKSSQLLQVNTLAYSAEVTEMSQELQLWASKIKKNCGTVEKWTQKSGLCITSFKLKEYLLTFSHL